MFNFNFYIYLFIYLYYNTFFNINKLLGNIKTLFKLFNKVLLFFCKTIMLFLHKKIKTKFRIYMQFIKIIINSFIFNFTSYQLFIKNL